LSALNGKINQNEQIMRNKANFPKSQMFITLLKTTNYNEKVALDSWSKQTQTKPTCPERSRGIYPLVLRAWRRFQFTIYYL
jgi:hypothetical protein